MALTCLIDLTLALVYYDMLCNKRSVPCGVNMSESKFMKTYFVCMYMYT